MTCWGSCPSSLSRWRQTRDTVWRRWALPPTYPYILTRKTAWLPRGALPITATTLCVLKVRSCAGGPSTVEIEVISMSLSQKCPVRTECLPPKQKRRYQPVYLRAKERNESEAYKQEMASRRSTVEGVFASQDRLGWERCKLRGLWKVDCEGYISALAHN